MIRFMQRMFILFAGALLWLHGLRRCLSSPHTRWDLRWFDRCYWHFDIMDHVCHAILIVNILTLIVQVDTSEESWRIFGEDCRHGCLSWILVDPSRPYHRLYSCISVLRADLRRQLISCHVYGLLASPLQGLGLNKFLLQAWSHSCLAEVEMDSEQVFLEILSAP